VRSTIPKSFGTVPHKRPRPDAERVKDNLHALRSIRNNNTTIMAYQTNSSDPNSYSFFKGTTTNYLSGNNIKASVFWWWYMEALIEEQTRDDRRVYFVLSDKGKTEVAEYEYRMGYRERPVEPVAEEQEEVEVGDETPNGVIVHVETASHDDKILKIATILAEVPDHLLDKVLSYGMERVYEEILVPALKLETAMVKVKEIVR
jgi:hypothetical protein